MFGELQKQFVLEIKLGKFCHQIAFRFYGLKISTSESFIAVAILLCLWNSLVFWLNVFLPSMCWFISAKLTIDPKNFTSQPLVNTYLTTPTVFFVIAIISFQIFLFVIKATKIKPLNPSVNKMDP